MTNVFQPHANRKNGTDRYSGEQSTLTFRRLEDVNVVLARVLITLQVAGVSSRDRYALRLAIEEGLVNAIRHGNQCDPTKIVELRYWLDEESVVIQINDQGEGFDPETVPDPLSAANLKKPGGRGLLLMRATTTWMLHNAKGNCVTFGKHLR